MQPLDERMADFLEALAAKLRDGLVEVEEALQELDVATAQWDGDLLDEDEDD